MSLANFTDLESRLCDAFGCGVDVIYAIRQSPESIAFRGFVCLIAERGADFDGEVAESEEQDPCFSLFECSVQRQPNSELGSVEVDRALCIPAEDHHVVSAHDSGSLAVNR